MNRKVVMVGALLAFFAVSSCTESNTETSTEETAPMNEGVEKELAEEEAEEEEKVEEIDVDQLVSAIDEKRAEIEAMEIAPVEVLTETGREKVKQKWSKIHYYTEDGKTLKIKTYPHEGVSKRTEEFYLDNGELVLVVIEDDGSGEKGKSKESIDKMYYFNNGAVIQELKGNVESEYSVKDGDAEELLSEFKEYMELYEASMAE
jgi:hypothetical protein